MTQKNRSNISNPYWSKIFFFLSSFFLPIIYFPHIYMKQKNRSNISNPYWSKMFFFLSSFFFQLFISSYIYIYIYIYKTEKQIKYIKSILEQNVLSSKLIFSSNYLLSSYIYKRKTDRIYQIHTGTKCIFF